MRSIRGTSVRTLQTGQEVAIKKINLGDVREVSVACRIHCAPASTCSVQPLAELRCPHLRTCPALTDQALPCKGRQCDGAAGDQAAAGATRSPHRPAAGRVCTQAQEPAAGAQPTQARGCLHAVVGAVQLRVVTPRGTHGLRCVWQSAVSSPWPVHDRPAMPPAGVRVLRDGPGAGHQGQLPDLLGGGRQVVHAGGAATDDAVKPAQRDMCLAEGCRLPLTRQD